MSDVIVHLTESLRTGFLDEKHISREEYRPQFLINDRVNGRTILDTLLKELKECDEFWFSVAFATKGGVATIISIIEELEKKGIKGKILVSQYLNFTEPEALKSLMQFKNVELRIIIDGEFHAKGYLFKRSNHYNLIIGSSNLTDSALRSNKEWNLKVSATHNSIIINNAIYEFKREFNNAKIVDRNFIGKYEKLYKSQARVLIKSADSIQRLQNKRIKPNAMQVEALANLKKIRADNKNRALIVSATGTGKTYLSAFDVKQFNPKRVLFIVHRGNILNAAMDSYREIFGNSRTIGRYTEQSKDLTSDFIFSTIQTISRDNHLTLFNKKQFSYIVLDETHRIGAESYQKVVNYFKPDFLLGMTATPERMDGFDVFKQFDYNIAYEIRLHRALEEQMLCPFHYYGIADITVDGRMLNENSAFTFLTAKERVNKIIEKAKFYGCDNGYVRGLIFCSSTVECDRLSKQFNKRGFKTVSLTGNSSEEERLSAIKGLENDNPNDKLDYIFTYDIFNEGIDIPKVNQIIMLRPTQSAIVFVQQLGRGLRKAENKEYLTIIDFIGNYKNNYLVPIALYGDTTYNKDTLRKLMVSGGSLIPGVSTINFDKISHTKILEAISNANLQLKKDLVNDYNNLKLKIGKSPMMMDFVEHGSRDPWLYISYLGSYYNFAFDHDKDLRTEKMSSKERKLLELFSKEIANTKRIEEVLILEKLIDKGLVTVSVVKEVMKKMYGIVISDETILSCVRNINFEFATEKKNRTIISLRQKYNLNSVSFMNQTIRLASSLRGALKNITFTNFLKDALAYSRSVYDKSFDRRKYIDGFILYRKYSRKDALRILNWEKNPVPQNVGGYIFNDNETICPIFVTYHKKKNISETTKYKDRFINNYEFEWISRSNRRLDSNELKPIINYKKGLRLPLFIKREDNKKDSEFYYLGDVIPIKESIEQTTISKGSKGSGVKIRFLMKQPVEDSIYQHIIMPIKQIDE